MRLRLYRTCTQELEPRGLRSSSVAIHRHVVVTIPHWATKSFIDVPGYADWLLLYTHAS
jgi:hypothetical protein